MDSVNVNHSPLWEGNTLEEMLKGGPELFYLFQVSIGVLVPRTDLSWTVVAENEA